MERRRAARSVLAVLLLAASPLRAPAAEPGVWCLVAFGTASPAGWCSEPHAGRITAVSQPFGAAWSKGTLFVRGIASPGVAIRVEVTDGSQTVGRTVTSSTVDDDGAGRPAGAFNAEIGVAELGTHTAGPSEPRTAYGGASTLTVTASPGEEGASAGAARAVEVLKLAGTPRDVSAPVAGTVRWPPTSWHPNLLGGASEGIIRGVANDDPPEAYGRASEIARITVTVRRGETDLWRPAPNVSRPTTTRGHWNLVLRHHELEPNWTPGSERYFIVVDIVDAWGNARRVTSPGITVYPW